MKRTAKDIFDQIVDLPPPDRANALERLCGEDSRLRAEVESLLDANDDAGDFLLQPTLAPKDAEPPQTEFLGSAASSESAEMQIAEGPGSIVDRYKLLEKIGEGGFGVVYMAQQSEPIRRRVALKIIKLGMDTKQVVARFEAERQALAMMDHANIARVIDGGSTETGRPYFVMELVRGEPITQYCDRNKLPLRDRLELFQQVCRAVQHAHQKGIIHRDIKPSNVLVTIADDRPLAKVIDFGIAKATNAELTEKTLFTEFRQLLGTPLYMSPEQAERAGVDVDTRTDIYSLGVLLYEILTGRTPLDPKKLNSAAWGELQRMIVEDEPTKPSVMVTTSTMSDLDEVAQRRGLEASQLGTSLRGDLDWIVLKAIDKDRSRRYATASQLNDDIERFLVGDSVEATPPSTVYRLKKFARRNRVLIGTLAAVFLAMLIGLVSTTMAATWAIRNEQLAKSALQRAKANESSARRAATLAGASHTLPEAEARRLAASWEQEIRELSSDPSRSESEITRVKSQYTTWYATWLFQQGELEEADQLIESCYAKAKESLGMEDPIFLALCNLRVLVLDQVDRDPGEYARNFGDLVESIRLVRGEEEAKQLLPEYSAALVKGKRPEEAAKAVNDYVAYRATKTEPPGNLENRRLDIAIDRLLNWGAIDAETGESDLVRQLRMIRQTGVASNEAATEESDDELASDFELMQGRWRYKGWKKGELVEHMVIEIDGKEVVSRWLDAESKTIRGRKTRLQLSRSGGVKVFTAYVSGDAADGGSFIYEIMPNRLILVSGMLQNRQGLPETSMRNMYRMQPGEAD